MLCEFTIVDGLATCPNCGRQRKTKAQRVVAECRPGWAPRDWKEPLIARLAGRVLGKADADLLRGRLEACRTCESLTRSGCEHHPGCLSCAGMPRWVEILAGGTCPRFTR